MINANQSTSDTDFEGLYNKNNSIRIGGTVKIIDDILAFLSQAGIEISTTPEREEGL